MRITAVKRVGVSALIACAFLLLAAPASAALFKGHYVGIQGTSFDLRVKTIEGKKHVTEMEHAGTPVTCENGESTLSGTSGVAFPDGRVRRGEFEVNNEFGGGDYIRFAGEIEQGKATGTAKMRITFSQPSGTCQTEKLHWVAKKR